MSAKRVNSHPPRYWLTKCEEEAKSAGHSIIAKFGSRTGNDYRHFENVVDFYVAFRDMGDEREAYEQYYEDRERMLYMDIDGYYNEPTTMPFLDKVLHVIAQVVEELCRVAPRFLLFHANRELHGEQEIAKKGGK